MITYDRNFYKVKKSCYNYIVHYLPPEIQVYLWNQKYSVHILNWENQNIACEFTEFYNGVLAQ